MYAKVSLPQTFLPLVQPAHDEVLDAGGVGVGGEVDEHGLVLRRLQLVPQEVLWEEEKQ